MATVVFYGMIDGALERLALGENEGIICDRAWDDGFGEHRTIETYVRIGNEVIYTHLIVKMVDGKPETLGGVEERCHISRLWEVRGHPLGGFPAWERKEI